jgi:N-acetylmuramoyl-L-alanine amidase
VLVIMKPDSRLVGGLHPSPNVGDRRNGCRPYLVVLHYTGMVSAEQAIEWLAHPESGVSCHYVVDEAGTITQMVSEAMRAWHAGVSQWSGESDVNSASIGIEIQNPGHDKGYPDFPPAQMQAVAELCSDIATRRAIAPHGIVAHSDVAPGRKIDPGEKFNWSWLADQGVGHWVEPAPLDAKCGDLVAECDADLIAQTQSLLRRYGYGVETHGQLDERTGIVIRAFQSHFRPARADGRLDRGTIETLTRLLAALPAPVTS